MRGSPFHAKALDGTCHRRARRERCGWGRVYGCRTPGSGLKQILWFFMPGELLFGPSPQKTGNLQRSGFLHQTYRSTSMEGKLETRSNMWTGDALPPRLHNTVFVARTYFLPITKTGRLRRDRLGKNVLLTGFSHAQSPSSSNSTREFRERHAFLAWSRQHLR